MRDRGGDKSLLIMTPDGSNAVEHHAGLIHPLRSNFRVVCFDMPGFGFSRPRRTYDHTLERGANLHVFEGCGHFPDLERPHQRSELVRAILSH